MIIWSFFTDPVLQAPTIGCMLMGLSTALMGVVVVLERRALLGEALSHAAYPGVVVSALIGSVLPFQGNLEIFVIFIAFASSLLGLWLIERLEKALRITSDAALCFVLSSFLGVGVLLASHLQSRQPAWFKVVQNFFYGQAATMVDMHIVIYAAFAICVIILLTLFYRPIHAWLFDRSFFTSVGYSSKRVERLLSLLITLTVVIGIRSGGVVLIAGLLLAPAVAMRQWSHRLHWMFCGAGAIGAFSGFLGNVLSTGLISGKTLPTGPMILLCAIAWCLFSFLFSSKKGVFVRAFRTIRFLLRCHEENLLKLLWKKGGAQEVDLKQCRFIARYWLLFKLKRKGWIEGSKQQLLLTKSGELRARQIVRLHRLWETYLVHLGHAQDRVHHSAEEMEHILTMEMSGELARLLDHPTEDPHKQPIPKEVL
jgi:manganese/zinc/iron transport system permease protein